MKAKILTLLREKKTYVSGQQLCEQFGVSRTAVWKAIKQLQKEGYTIEAVPKMGYLLVETVEEVATEIYSQNELSSRMNTVWAGKPVYFHETIGSTNVEAKHLAEAGATSGTLVVADMQTAGRGRRGRAWISPAGSNIYFTIILKPTFGPDKASMLTLVIAHAIAKSFREFLGLGDMVGIKWPNDIVIDGRKTCGILTEMSVEQDYIQHVVIGVGINVRKQEFAPEIADKAIALDEVCDKPVDRSKLIASIMGYFEDSYEQFAKAESMAYLKESYNTFLVNKDREVCVLDPAGEYRGVAKGINDTGELLVELPDGTCKEVYAGEVSVRGIYGYV